MKCFGKYNNVIFWYVDPTVAIIGDPDDSARQAGLTALLAVLVIILHICAGDCFCYTWDNLLCQMEKR